MCKEEVETVRFVFDKGKYYYSKDCLIDSLVRLENSYNCKKCALLDTIDTVRIMCPLIMKREIGVFR